MEEFEYQGFWWLPNEPESRVPGTLRFDPEEGSTLNLLGLLGSVEDSRSSFEPELILGDSAEGRHITLRGCARTEANVGFGAGVSTSSFRANMVLIGEHFEQAEDVGFERLIIEYLHLDAWAGITGFQIAFVDDPETHPITVRHELPEPIPAVVEDEYEVNLYFGSSFEASPVRLRR